MHHFVTNIRFHDGGLSINTRAVELTAGAIAHEYTNWAWLLSPSLNSENGIAHFRHLYLDQIRGLEPFLYEAEYGELDSKQSEALEGKLHSYIEAAGFATKLSKPLFEIEFGIRPGKEKAMFRKVVEHHVHIGDHAAMRALERGQSQLGVNKGRIAEIEKLARDAQGQLERKAVDLRTTANALVETISTEGGAVQSQIRRAEESFGKELQLISKKVLADGQSQVVAAVAELQSGVDGAKRLRENFSAELYEDFTKHKTELDAVKKAVAGAMEIDAAHTHWKERAEGHRSAKGSTEKRFWVLLGATVFAVAGYVGAVMMFGTHLLMNTSGIPNIGATLLILSPILFAVWALRFFQAQYMVERDSELEAHSRATMAQTYVGLLGSGSVDDRHASFTNEQRLLILGSLFRPASPGGVHDASPPFGLEIVSRVLGGTKDRAKVGGDS